MSRQKKGISLAKGPVGLIGLVLLAYGVTAFILGGHSFRADPVSGTVNGETWLGIEVNAWSSLLFIGAGALLLFASPMHWAAKSLALIVGVALGAASVIALYDRNDVFGIFAANGPTAAAWGAAGTLLILISLLPRIGGRKPVPEAQPRPARPTTAVRTPQEPPVSHTDREHGVVATGHTRSDAGEVEQDGRVPDAGRVVPPSAT